MNLEQQCVSLELAKRLKELGVMQESYFTWVWVMRSIDDTHDVYEIKDHYKPTLMSTEYSAFTVAELGEKIITPVTTVRYEDYWCCSFFVSKYEQVRFEDTTEANARSLMLIYLIENKLI